MQPGLPVHLPTLPQLCLAELPCKGHLIQGIDSFSPFKWKTHRKQNSWTRSQRHFLCAWVQTGPLQTQECSFSHCFNIITSASFAVTQISFAGVCNEYKLMSIFKHLDAEMNFSILPSQIGSSAERFLSNKTVNKDILGLLSCIHLHEHKPTCWFTQTQLQAGQCVSFPCHLSPVVSCFWQIGTQMIQGKTRCLQSLLGLSHSSILHCLPLTERKLCCKKSRFSAMKWEKQHLRLD